MELTVDLARYLLLYMVERLTPLRVVLGEVQAPAQVMDRMVSVVKQMPTLVLEV